MLWTYSSLQSSNNKQVWGFWILFINIWPFGRKLIIQAKMNLSVWKEIHGGFAEDKMKNYEIMILQRRKYGVNRFPFGLLDRHFISSYISLRSAPET